MLSFNTSDVEGSLPQSFPLLNKNNRIWSIFEIQLMGQIFCRQISQRYLLFHLLATHILNLSAARCYSQMFSMLSPCHAQRMNVLYHSQLSQVGYTESKAAPNFISWTCTNLGAVFVPDINHIFLISFEMKQEYKNIPISTNNNSFEFMRLFKFVGIGACSLRSRSSINFLQSMCPFCVSCHN